MRNTWNHTAPSAIQPEPADNGSAAVTRQVAAWRATGVLIHPESAMAIAAYWQAPTGYGYDFLRFAQSGDITDDLADAMNAEIASAAGRADDACAADTHELQALSAYVRACTVTPWLWGHNMAGCMPEAEVGYSLEYASALAGYEEELERYFNSLECEDCDPDTDAEQAECHVCTEARFTEAELESVRAAARRLPGADETERSYLANPEQSHITYVYWLTRGEPMAYGAFLAEQEARYV